MTYDYPTWVFAAAINILKLQCLQDKVLHITTRILQEALVRVCAFETTVMSVIISQLRRH